MVSLKYSLFNECIMYICTIFYDAAYDLAMIAVSVPAFDPAAGSTGPAGHQYHSVTHHPYHHSDPVRNVLDPKTQSLPIDRRARQPKVRRAVCGQTSRLAIHVLQF